MNNEDWEEAIQWFPYTHFFTSILKVAPNNASK